jgi:hypothetical protein
MALKRPYLSGVGITLEKSDNKSLFAIWTETAFPSTTH